MKHARIQYQGSTFHVTVDPQGNICLPDGRNVSSEHVIWLPPATGTLFALGLNYADHAAELDFSPERTPDFY